MPARLIRRRDCAVERGATAVEYGLLVALIAGVIVVAVTTFGRAGSPGPVHLGAELLARELGRKHHELLSGMR